MRAVDLSLPLRSGMQVYPGDPEVAIDGALTVPVDGVAVARLGLNTHAGTHLDAPAHTIVGGRTVENIPLEWLVGEARVLRVIDALPESEIAERNIEGDLPEQLPGIVFVATGWDQYAGTPKALQHPFLSPDFATILMERGARVVGIDAFSPDPTGSADPADEILPAHAVILGADGVIIENLTGLSEIPDSVLVTLLPLRVQDGDGSPIRAVAWLEKESASGAEAGPKHS